MFVVELNKLNVAFQGSDDGYVCFGCFSKLHAEGMQHKDLASVRPTSPKRARYSCRSRPKCCRKRRRESVISSLAIAVRNYHYCRAFRLLLATGPAARCAFRNVMADMIRREMTKYCRGPSNIPKFTGSDSINSFCWKSVLAELQDTVPTLYKAVNSSMPNKLQNDDREPKYACTMLLYMNLRFILCISRVIFSIYVIIICYLVLIFVCLKLISEK